MTKLTKCLSVWCPIVLASMGLVGLTTAADNTQSLFVSAGEDFPRSELNLRKWDAPVVADLDQDGWVDILQNDHGYSTQIVWNNKGKYAEPWDVLMGDMHGITVGDFDQDGLLEVVLSRGGGSGSNARNAAIYKIGKDRSIQRMADFDEPLAFMRGRTVQFFDGNGDGALDLLNFAFPSSEKKGQSESFVYKNDGNGQLVKVSALPPTHSDGQKTLITDFDGDGKQDLLIYGHAHLKAFNGDGSLHFNEVTEQVLPEKIRHVTGIVELDFDGDGDMDLYLSRGKDFEAGDTFYNAQESAWGFFTKRGKFQFEDLIAGDVINLVNYQSPWPNKKVFIGESGYEHEFHGETHSGKDITFVSSDSLGWPDEITKKGLSIGFVGNKQWRLAGETWSPMSAVVLGVQGAPTVTRQQGVMDTLLENRNGVFVDVSKKVGITSVTDSTGVVAADFNNDGFQDLVVVQRGDLVSENVAQVLLNNGKGKFDSTMQHGIVSPELGAIGMGVEVIDYNRDGKVDVVLGNERGLWHLFKNQQSAIGNYVVLDLGEIKQPKSTKEKAATTLGALVTIEACGNRQSKRVGAGGAMYSRSFNRYIHFGVGQCKKIDSLSVRLTTGKVVKVKKPKLNKVTRL